MIRPVIYFFLLVTVSYCLECTSNKVYAKVTKSNGIWSSEEKYEIKGNSQVIAVSPTFVDGQMDNSEFCLDATTNSQYQIRMYDIYGDGWSDNSWVRIEGQYGNYVFKNFLSTNSQETFSFSLYYGIHKQAQWKMVTGSASGSWKQVDYSDSAWTEVTLGSVSTTVSGTQYFRKAFTGLSGMAAYEIRMNYRYGIIAYINGVEIYRDNMPTGEATSSTLASGSYSTIDYRGVIRPGSEIASTQSLLAIELHFLSQEQSIVDFDAFLALLASSINDDTCFIYPYTTTLLAGEYTAEQMFDFGRGSYFISTPNTDITYTFDGPKAYINALRSWPFANINTAPSSFLLQGSDSLSSTTWTTIVSATNVIYSVNTYHIATGLFNARVFDNYRVRLISSSSTDINAYEMQLITCSIAAPSTIEFGASSYNYYAKFESVLIQPVISEITNCQINPQPPAGLVFSSSTCTLSGKHASVMQSTPYTVTATIGGSTLSGTFTLSFTECSGAMINLLRTYKYSALYEAFSIKDLASQQVVYEVAYSTSQQSNSNWNYALCLPGSKYEVTVSCLSSSWQPNSFLYINSILDDNDYETILRVNYDSNIGLSNVYDFNVQYAITPASQWYYKMGEVPSNWYNNDVSGWSQNQVNLYPESSNQIQLYKMNFNVASIENIATVVISLRYQYGVLIYLNNNEAFRLGISGDLSTSSLSTIAFDNVNFRQISLPLKAPGKDSIPVKDFIIQGQNTIAIALIASNSNIKTSTFDCAVRLAGVSSVSRVFDFSISSSMGVNAQNLFIPNYPNVVSRFDCSANYIEITFNDHRHEWISSIALKLHYQQKDMQPKQFVMKAKNEDETEWTTLSTVSNLSWTLIGQRNRVWIPNNKSYNKYRIENIATGSQTDCAWQLNMIDLMSDATGNTIPAFSYESTSIFKDIEIAEIYPNSDFYYGYSITPALPTGISMDVNTGIISGITTAVGSTTHTISATKYTGEAVSTSFSLNCEVCTGGRSLITLVASIDSYPREASYRLYQGKGISSQPVRQIDSFKTSSLNYADFCLNHGLYTLELRDTESDGWTLPNGYYLTVDIGTMRFEMGQVYTGNKPTSVTTMFSSLLPFQIEYDDWKVYKNDVDLNWNTIDYNDSTWAITKANAIGTSESVTVYLRREVNIPDINDYQVLNIHIKYAGGIVCYFNGRKVARFNLDEDYDSLTESIEVHDSTTFSQFHIILPSAGAVTGKNIIAFEIHRPTGQSSSIPVLFDATGVFGVNECSVVVDSYINIMNNGVFNPTLPNLFDLNPTTYNWLTNEVGNNLEWTVENLEGSKFNSFAMESAMMVSNLGFSLYGREGDTEYLSMFAQADIQTKNQGRVAWPVPVGVISFRQFKWEIDAVGNGAVSVSSFLFQYCRPSGTGLCEGVDIYPTVAEGQISAAPCEEGFRGYSYRECSNGHLGEIKTDKCIFRLPSNLQYAYERIIVVKDVQTQIAAPSYHNIITHFYLAENTQLPPGLVLDENTGIIRGVASEEGVYTFMVFGSNPVGATSTELTIQVRIAECKAESNFPTTRVGTTVEYECSSGGSFIGSQRRTCNLGVKDGEWSKTSGTCWSVAFVIIVIVLVVVIVAILVIVILKMNKNKKKATSGSKGKKVAKKTPKKVVKV